MRPEDHDRLEEWLEGSLPAAEAAEFEDHLRDCPQCRAEAERAKTLTRLAGALPAARAPATIRETVSRRFVPRRAPRALRPAVVLAFAAAAAVVLFLVLPRGRAPEGPRPAPILAAATANALMDWLDQARHSAVSDAVRLIEEARVLGLREELRRRLETAPAEDREGLLAFEDLLTQLLASPSADSLPEEARLVAHMVGR